MLVDGATLDILRYVGVRLPANALASKAGLSNQTSTSTTQTLTDLGRKSGSCEAKARSPSPSVDFSYRSPSTANPDVKHLQHRSGSIEPLLWVRREAAIGVVEFDQNTFVDTVTAAGQPFSIPTRTKVFGPKSGLLYYSNTVFFGLLMRQY